MSISCGPNIFGIHFGMTLDELRDAAFTMDYQIGYLSTIGDMVKVFVNRTSEDKIDMTFYFKNDRLNRFVINDWREAFLLKTDEITIYDFLEMINNISEYLDGTAIENKDDLVIYYNPEYIITVNEKTEEIEFKHIFFPEGFTYTDFLALKAKHSKD